MDIAADARVGYVQSAADVERCPPNGEHHACNIIHKTLRYTTIREACTDQCTALEDQLAPYCECKALKPAAVEGQRAIDAVVIADTVRAAHASR